MSFRSVFLGVIVAVSWTMGSSADADDFVYIPLALGIEQEQVQSSMYLGVNLVSAEIDFTAREPSDVSFPEPWLRECYAFLQAMVEGSIEPDGLADGFLRPELVPAEFLEFIAPVYEGAELASFDGAARLGDVILLSYTMTKHGFEEAQPAFLILQEDERGFHLNPQLAANHFAALVHHSLRAFHQGGSSQGRESLDDSWHTVAIPPFAGTGGHAEEGETIAVIGFQGFRPGWGEQLFEDGEPVTAEAPSDSMRDQAVAFYHTLQHLYVSIPADEGFNESPEMQRFMSMLTDRSRERMEMGFSTLTPEQFAGTLEWYPRGRERLLYVLDAHPVYIMFYSSMPSLNFLGSHDYLIVAEDGEFKLANLNRVLPFGQVIMHDPVQSDLLAIMNNGAGE